MEKSYRERVTVFITKKINGVTNVLATESPRKFMEKGEIFLSMPGGGVDDGETLLIAAERECIEEVNIDIKHIRILEEPVTISSYEGKTPEIDNAHYRERFQKYAGERTHYAIAEFDKYTNTFKQFHDSRKYDFYPIKELIKKLKIQQNKYGHLMSSPEVYQARIDVIEKYIK